MSRRFLVNGRPYRLALILLLFLPSLATAQIEPIPEFIDDTALPELDPRDAANVSPDEPPANIGRTASNPIYYGNARTGRAGSISRSWLFSSQAPKRRNARFGPVDALIITSQEFEFNSNTTLSSSPEPDVIIRPLLALTFDWEITRANSLTLQMGVGYDYYVIHPDLGQGGPILDPTTTLMLNVESGDFRFSIYEAPAITRDASENPSLTGVTSFGQFSNTVGIGIEWNLNKLMLTAGVERQDVLSVTGDFNSLNQYGYTVYVGGVYDITPTISGGIRANISTINYYDDVLNNSVETVVAATLNTRLSRFTNLLLEAGVQSISSSDDGNEVSDQDEALDSENVTGTLGGGDFIGPYIRMGVTNQLTRYITHSLLIENRAQPSLTSNYDQFFAVQYDLSWTANRWLTTTAALRYEAGKLSGEGLGNYQRYGFEVGANFEIIRNWSLNLLFVVDAQVTTYGQSYLQNREILGITYQF